jgi:hypothetical protein
MKNTLKIRFIETIGDSYSTYHIEYKKWFFWRTNWVAIGGSPAGVAYDRIYSASKDKCLAQNLHFMGLCKDYLNIIEFPSIKKY